MAVNLINIEFNIIQISISIVKFKNYLLFEIIITYIRLCLYERATKLTAKKKKIENGNRYSSQPLSTRVVYIINIIYLLINRSHDTNYIIKIKL